MYIISILHAQRMELLTPADRAIVHRHSGDKPGMTAYVLAIKELIHVIDCDARMHNAIVLLCKELIDTLKRPDIIDIDGGRQHAFSLLNTLFLAFKNRTRVDQGFLNTGHELFLCLSAAPQQWVQNNTWPTEIWYLEKSEIMRKLLDSYYTRITNNSHTLRELQTLEAYVWLAASHSNQIATLTHGGDAKQLGRM